MRAVATNGGEDKNYDEDYSYSSATGNLASKDGKVYTYSASHKHAVTGLSNGNSYQYDANGNMIVRSVPGEGSYNFGYDAENHLTGVSGSAQAQFTYNGDGQRVVATEGVTTTVFVGNYFEWQVNNSQATKYYYAGGTRVAMQRGGEGVKYLLGDHLGSASVVLNADGTQLGSQGYMPWGEVNFTEGTIPTKYTLMGQYSYTDSFGLMYFNARWFLPELGRFNQPDTVIPEAQQGTIAWDRYGGLNNNPIRYNDFSGHSINSSSSSPYYTSEIPWWILVLIIAGALTLDRDGRRRHEMSSTTTCEDSLAECFGRGQRREFSENEEIGGQEFSQLLDAISDDLNSKLRTPFDPARGGYDTPFWDGNSRFGTEKHKDVVVCIEGYGCYRQSAINYVAQGMYSARTGETLEFGKKWVSWWNQIVWGHEPSEEELYWFEIGYYAYLERKVTTPTTQPQPI